MCSERVYEMHLIFLGTASCYPTKHRGVSCTAVKFNDGDVWLFDCGEGSQVQIQKSQIHSAKVTKIFITHLHGDHLFGLPGFLCTLGTIDRKEQFTLEIYGPLGLRRYVRESLNLSRSPLNFQYVVHELVPKEWQYPEDLRGWKIDEEANCSLHPQEILGKKIESTGNTWILFEDAHGSVRAGPLVHRVPCFGFVIQEHDTPGTLNSKLLLDKGLKPGPLYGKLKKGESITLENGEIIHPSDVVGQPFRGNRVTILGDTRDSNEMIDIAMNSDVLLHEATLEDAMQEKAIENGHSTPKMAVEFAHKINAKQLILFHFSQRYRLDEEPSLNILLSEAMGSIARLNMPCKVSVAHDLMEMDISHKRSNSS